jgi:N-acetylglucosaminyl-diphospho-decaprenol L-rhamnosyltransferase
VTSRGGDFALAKRVVAADVLSADCAIAMMKLYIVICNYKVTDLTLDCLRSLQDEIDTVPGTRVGVCENGTGPADAARLQQAIDVNGWARWCDFLAVFPNRGFCGGNNVMIWPAVRSSDPPQYVMLLNADTVVRPGALKALVDFMDQNPRIGIAGARLEDPDGTPQTAAFRFQNILSEFDRGLRVGFVSKLLAPWLQTMPIPTVPTKVDWVPGAGMIIRREVIEQIGALDEGYYTYFDDIDFCRSARRAGWPTWYVPQSRIVHLVGASTGVTAQQPTAPKRRPTYYFQARRRYFLKHHGPLYAMLADAAYLLGASLQCIWQKLRGLETRDPPHLLRDSFLNSVFVTGTRLRDVENPALKTAPPSGASPSPA